jgi:hypothetical protein
VSPTRIIGQVLEASDCQASGARRRRTASAGSGSATSYRRQFRSRTSGRPRVRVVRGGLGGGDFLDRCPTATARRR